jgi:hypothetical protein
MTAFWVFLCFIIIAICSYLIWFLPAKDEKEEKANTPESGSISKIISLRAKDPCPWDKEDLLSSAQENNP